MSQALTEACHALMGSAFPNERPTVLHNMAGGGALCNLDGLRWRKQRFVMIPPLHMLRYLHLTLR